MNKQEFFKVFSNNAREVYDKRKKILALEKKMQENLDSKSLMELEKELLLEIKLLKILLDENHEYSKLAYEKAGLKMGLR